MRIVILASGAFATPTIRWLAQSSHEIPLVVTQPARGSGRGRHATPTPVKILADELRLPVVEVENVNVPEFVSRIRDLDARVMLAIAFGQKLSVEFLSAARGGAINLHASLLPKYRGAAPINWAIVRGETQTGCTVFKIVSKMDAGAILAQDTTEILPDETAGQLHDRLAELGVRTVQKALSLYELAADPPGEIQDESAGTLAPKLKKSDGYINFSNPARRIVNQIRGMTPWPGATARIVTAENRSETVTILRAQATPLPSRERASGEGQSADGDNAHLQINPTGSPSAPPPLIRGEQGGSARTPGMLDETLRVTTSDGLLQILEIQPAGGRAMSWRDFVNGRHIRPGHRVESP